MVINREFFFRGWLPAGLVINARLIATAPVRTGQAVMKPLICPAPGAGWPIDQPFPTFPVDQATADTAIVLADPIPHGTVALLPLGEWYGKGTPYIVGINTWYEGRIRIVSGEDVMAIRLIAAGSPTAYSNYTGVEQPDVVIIQMPCHHIIGPDTSQLLAADPGGITDMELGHGPRISGSNGQEIPSRVLNVIELTSASFAGMQVAYAEPSPGADVAYIRCSITDGRFFGDTPKYIGLMAAPTRGQKYYNITPGAIGSGVTLIAKPGQIGTVAYGASTDQAVHYN